MLRLLLATAVLLAATPALAQPSFRLTGDRLVWLGGEVPLGCTGLALVRVADRVFVACGEPGVVAVDLATEPPSVLPLATPAPSTSVYLADGFVWAGLANGRAHRLSPAPNGAEVLPPVPTPPAGSPEDDARPVGLPRLFTPPTARAPSAATSDVGDRAEMTPGAWVVEGVVAERREGRVLVRFSGSVLPGLAVEFRRPANEAERRRGELPRVAAHGTIMELGPNGAWVSLEANAAVSSDMSALTTGDRARIVLAPPLPVGTTEVGVLARPYLPLKNFAFGLALEGWVTSTMALTDNLALEVNGEITMLNVAVGDVRSARAPIAMVGHGTVSLSSRWIAVGLGFGSATVSQETGVVSGFSFGQRLRLGNEDGLSFRLRANAVIVPNLSGEERWTFGDVYGELRVPLADGVWLNFGGGGGRSGSGYGEAGVRVRLIGGGLADSMFFTAGGGFAFLSSRNFRNAGPMLTFGLSYRL